MSITQFLTKEIFVGERRYTFHKERFADVLSQLPRLFIENHKEASVTADLKLDPDLERYVDLEGLGFIIFLTIRYREEIVGYCLFYVDEDIRHRGVKSATQDMMFISKKHRGIGMSFMQFCDDILQRCGVNVVWRQATCFQDISPMFERLGYVFAQKSYVKRF